MAIRPIVLLGDPRLYQPSPPVQREQVPELLAAIEDLHDTMRAFWAEHGWGRAISAPQIGVHARIVCMNDQVRPPTTFINPMLDLHSAELVEHWEDCMSFPELLVRLLNPRRCRLRYRDVDWREHTVELSDDYAELLQHEVDHLDGVLSISRAIDARSIALRRALPAKPTRLAGEFRELDS
jgi:peptide deformylase